MIQHAQLEITLVYYCMHSQLLLLVVTFHIHRVRGNISLYLKCIYIQLLYLVSSDYIHLKNLFTISYYNSVNEFSAQLYMQVRVKNT